MATKEPSTPKSALTKGAWEELESLVGHPQLASKGARGNAQKLLTNHKLAAFCKIKGKAMCQVTKEGIALYETYLTCQPLADDLTAKTAWAMSKIMQALKKELATPKEALQCISDISRGLVTQACVLDPVILGIVVKPSLDVCQKAYQDIELSIH